MFDKYVYVLDKPERASRRPSLVAGAAVATALATIALSIEDLRPSPPTQRPGCSPAVLVAIENAARLQHRPSVRQRHAMDMALGVCLAQLGLWERPLGLRVEHLDSSLGFVGMRVFISWSGALSRQVAEVMRDWLPLVVQSVEPFMSSQDIRAGDRWQRDIADRLSDTDFGIVCVTKANQKEPWLNFEAGALAKAIDASRVVPLAIDLAESDIEFPLGQFQATPVTPVGMRRLVVAVNAACPQPIDEEIVGRAFDLSWQEFSSRFDSATDISPSVEPVASSRSERHMLEEVLDTLRSMSRSQFPIDPRRIGTDDDGVGKLTDSIAGLIPGILQIRTNYKTKRLTLLVTEPVPPPVLADITVAARAAHYSVRFVEGGDPSPGRRGH